MDDAASVMFQLFKAIQRGQLTEEKVTNAVYLHTYLTYLRQTKTAERNLLMVDSLKSAMGRGRAEEGKKLTKPQDLARLYDIIIQVRVKTKCGAIFTECSIAL